MPQMSPMWWTTLMIVFIISTFVCMFMMYFNFKKSIKNKKMYFKKNMNWTW